MKKLFIILLAIFAGMLCIAGCNSTPDANTDAQGTDTQGSTGENAVSENIKIHSIDQLNLDEGDLDSHVNEWNTSYLEADFRSIRTLRSKELKTSNYSYYPRIKVLPDGKYILTYQDGRWGPNIYYTISEDLETWSTPKKLFEKTTIDGDTKKFATADILVLDNGDVIAVCCYLSENNYSKRVDYNGLCMKRSTDGGYTWSETKYIYKGTAWEPGLLQLETGEVHIYFTHTAPYIEKYGYNTTIRSSGSALLRSYDNANTWTPDVKGPPYSAHIVMQTYIGEMPISSFRVEDRELGGITKVKIFNDQMPVPILLHNGTIALAAETQHFNNVFKISVGYSSDNWKTPLGMEQAGPSDKQTDLYSGVAPYLAQFRSGETVLTYTASKNMTFRVGDSAARKFGEAQTPFKEFGGGLWSSTEIIGSHTLVANTDYIFNTNDNNSMSLVVLGKMHLNHTLNAKKMTCTVDGSSDEWSENTDALFIGSISQAQATVRYAHDDGNVYLLVERLDEYLSKYNDEVTVFVKGGADSFFKITFDVAKGVSEISISRGGKYTKQDLSLFSSAMKINGTVGDDTDTDVGAVFELAIPKSLFDSVSDQLSVNISLKNTDSGNKFENDTVDGIRMDDTSTWIKVNLK